MRSNVASVLIACEELYAWQTNGPFRYDFCGNAPQGRRDAGAIELIESESELNRSNDEE